MFSVTYGATHFFPFSDGWPEACAGAPRLDIGVLLCGTMGPASP